MPEEDFRERLYAAYKHRALLYWHIFDELRQEIGHERAASLMKRAIHKRGLVVGQKYAGYGPNDVLGLKDAFIANSADGGRMFSPTVARADAEAVHIVQRTCPLKDAWRDAGLSDDDLATMCDIAAAIDAGVFETAGVDFQAQTWKPGSDDCCHLHFRPKT